MTSVPPERPRDGPRSDEPSAPVEPPGRTAFDALNPYGDFGGPEVSGGRFAFVVALAVVAVGGLLAVGAVLAKDALTVSKEESVTQEASEPVAAAPSPPDEEAAPSPPLAPTAAAAEEPTTTEPPAASPAPEPAPPPRAAPVEAPKPAPPARPAPRARRQPAPPPRSLVVTYVRDRSDSDYEGLTEALQRGFVERLRAVASDLPLKVGVRAKSTDLGVRVLLLRLDEGSGGGAHDVRARCALATRPKDALPGGPMQAQGRQQAMEQSAALREEAVRRCGAQLADTLAPLARQFLE